MTAPDTKLYQAASTSIFRDIAEAGREVRQYRGLLRELVLREIRIRYKQAVLGFGWAVLMPLLIIAAGVVVRLAIAQISGSGFDRTAILGVAIKSLPWAFFVGSLNFATPRPVRFMVPTTSM